MNTHLFVPGAHRPYVGPLEGALRLTPWVALGAAVLVVAGLGVSHPGTPDARAVDAPPTAGPVAPVRYTTLPRVEVVGRRDITPGASAVASRHGPDAVTLGP